MAENAPTTTERAGAARSEPAPDVARPQDTGHTGFWSALDAALAAIARWGGVATLEHDSRRGNGSRDEP
jgi:hypothetical protein